MIIFQRGLTFLGPPDEVGAWSLEITQAVNERTPLDVSLWSISFGAPIGTMVWSAQVESLMALEAATDPLGADRTYLSLVQKARDWVREPGQDVLTRVSHTAGGEYARPTVGGYAESTVAIPAEGKLVEASAFGVEISDLHADITHAPVLFGNTEYGEFGEMRWIAVYESAAALDLAAETIAKDADYAATLDGAGPLFQPGSARRVLARRIA
jgi:hypothetical protein